MIRKIYINPGHSDTDPGAVGFETERPLNVRTARWMELYLLENYLCETRMNPGTLSGVSQIARDANDWGADLMVSIHFNAGGGDGYEALVFSNARMDLGQIFEKYVKAAGQNSRGVKLRPDLGILRLTSMPAILNEGAFVDTLRDISDWNEEEELKQLGVAYAQAAAEYLELPKKSSGVDAYTLEQFVREVQTAIGAEVDGIAGPETIGKTVTVSRYINDTHPVVLPVQKWLAALGYTQVGQADGEAGKKFDAALKAFQADHHCWVDGEATAGMKTWRKLLQME